MLKLTEKEHEFFQMLREAGVLADINFKLLDHSNGVILFPCSDGDHFDDIYTLQGKICRVHRADLRVHPLALNGGPLLLARSLPVCRKLREDITLLNHAEGAISKGFRVITLCGHAPCMRAREFNLTPVQYLDGLCEAKSLMLEGFPGMTVASFFHVFWPDGRRRSHFVSRQAWKKFRAENWDKLRREFS